MTGDVRIADVDSDGLPDLCTRSIEGFDAIGMPVLVGRWRKNPGQGSRDIESWAIMPFPDGPLPGRHFSDFDGDGNEEWVAFANYLKASPSGPVRSDEFNFVGDADFSSYKVQAIEDFDNDGDADFLLGGTGYNPLVLLRNPLVDQHDPLVARMREAGIVGALSGMTNDADDDGRDNFTELTQGTNLLSPETSIQNPYLMNLEVDGSVAILAYRVPWRAVGLGSAEVPVSLSELGIQFSIDSSPDLIDWETSDRSSGIMVFSDGTWSYFAKGYVRADAACYFRLRASP